MNYFASKMYENRNNPFCWAMVANGNEINYGVIIEKLNEYNKIRLFGVTTDGIDFKIYSNHKLFPAYEVGKTVTLFDEYSYRVYATFCTDCVKLHICEYNPYFYEEEHRVSNKYLLYRGFELAWNEFYEK